MSKQPAGELTTVEALKKLMAIWDAVTAKVAAMYPDADDAERYRLASAVMNKGLGIS